MWRALAARVRGLLLHPRAELSTTLAEPGDPKAVLVPYVVTLAALGPVALFLVGGVFGVYHPPTSIFNTVIPGGWLRAPGTAALDTLVAYGVSVGSWFVLDRALVVLAPKFGGLPDGKGAHKAAAYTLTPLWVAGVLQLLGSLPYVGFFSSLALIAALAYAVFIGRHAAPLHMGTPDDKAAGHVLLALGVTVAACALAYFGLSKLVAAAAPRLS